MDAIIADLCHFDQRPNYESMLMGYIGLSRVKGADGLLLSEILAPMLFRQGPLPGPSLLIEFLSG